MEITGVSLHIFNNQLSLCNDGMYGHTCLQFILHQQPWFQPLEICGLRYIPMLMPCSPDPIALSHRSNSVGFCNVNILSSRLSCMKSSGVYLASANDYLFELKGKHAQVADGPALVNLSAKTRLFGPSTLGTRFFMQQQPAAGHVTSSTPMW